MATVTVRNQIAAPIDRVFQSFTDIESGTPHVSGIKKIELLTPGPFGLGTRWQETREVLGVTDSAGLPPGFLKPLNWAIAGKVRDVIGHDLADLKASLEQ